MHVTLHATDCSAHEGTLFAIFSQPSPTPLTCPCLFIPPCLGNAGTRSRVQTGNARDLPGVSNRGEVIAVRMREVFRVLGRRTGAAGAASGSWL